MISINDRLQQILEKIQLYQHNSDVKKRDLPTQNIQLVAVSKKFGVGKVLEAHAAGQRHFAENYLQEAMAKIDDLRQNHSEINQEMIWHYIGQAQSNKCKYLVRYFNWVQTVDDLAFAEKLNREMLKYIEKTSNAALKINICLQINIDGSAQKNGLPPEPEQLNKVVDYMIDNCPYLKLRGLMVIPDETGEQTLRQHFAKAHELFITLQKKYPKEMIDTLSMGMSQDMALAIEEGSTMVRVGQGIFGERG